VRAIAEISIGICELFIVFNEFLNAVEREEGSREARKEIKDSN